MPPENGPAARTDRRDPAPGRGSDSASATADVLVSDRGPPDPRAHEKQNSSSVVPGSKTGRCSRTLTVSTRLRETEPVSGASSPLRIFRKVGLARPVPPDEADLLSRVDPEGHLLEQGRVDKGLAHSIEGQDVHGR